MTPPGRTPARGFCAPATPLSAIDFPAAAALLPELDDAVTLASLLHSSAHARRDELVGELLPRATLAMEPDEALGICAHWRDSAQDVDFERKLLLRALLSSLQPGACLLPEGCASLDELDLAPLKVQSLLKSLSARKVVDLGSNQFRWDMKQPPPRLAWGGDERESRSHSPPWAGLSKRQLQVASYEALLLAVGDELGTSGEDDVHTADGTADSAAETLRCIAAQLGIGSRQHRNIRVALRPATTAVPPGQAPASEASPTQSASPAPDGNDGALLRCGLRLRLRLLRTTVPADFATDNDFFEWQERQAALLGASLHAALSELADQFDDPECSPAFGMGALVDAQFMELLATSRPTTHASEAPRSSDGFPDAMYRACIERIDGLYSNVLKLLRDESGDAADGSAASAPEDAFPT